MFDTVPYYFKSVPTVTLFNFLCFANKIVLVWIRSLLQALKSSNQQYKLGNTNKLTIVENVKPPIIARAIGK